MTLTILITEIYGGMPMKDVYERLREHLDKLPGGFPATESGVELRILKRLFTPEDAELVQHLKLKLEPATVIAERAGLSMENAAERLKSLARKGLIFSIETPERPHAYMAAQFVVGIWEYHVNELDKDFIRDMEEYLPILSKEAFDFVPQLRTIPVNTSIHAGLKVLPYEQAENLIRKQKKFAVAPCICRREHQIKGEGCGKLMEACLMFGWAADYYVRNGLGRIISLEETLDIIKKAEEEGLVLQPSNSQEIVNICCCCGDCCQVLLHLKRHPMPASMVASPFIAEVDREACTGCEICLERCQMDAIEMEDERARVNSERCIGCGLCVSTCSGEALSLKRKPEDMQPHIPKNQMEAHALRAQARARVKVDLDDKLNRYKRI
jgi:electron transport complex protein RnfB